MAINQAVNANPDSATLIATLERLVEPGLPRLFFDPTAKPPTFVTPSSALTVPTVPIVPDPFIRGQFLIQVPTLITRDWPDQSYLITVRDIASQNKDEILFQITVFVINGDDGGNKITSIDLTIMGQTVRIYNATQVNAPPKAVVAATVSHLNSK